MAIFFLKREIRAASDIVNFSSLSSKFNLNVPTFTAQCTAFQDFGDGLCVCVKSESISLMDLPIMRQPFFVVASGCENLVKISRRCGVLVCAQKERDGAWWGIRG